MQKFQFYTASPLKMRACGAGRKFAEYDQCVEHVYINMLLLTAFNLNSKRAKHNGSII
jgi:hypothetical protein